MKYTNIEVLSTGYVSSSCDYFVNIRCVVKGVACYNSYCITRGGFTALRGGLQYRPQYMVTEIKRQVALLVKDDSITWHEYDRDGNKRYDNLRYYDRDLLLEIVKDW